MYVTLCYRIVSYRMSSMTEVAISEPGSAPQLGVQVAVSEDLSCLLTYKLVTMVYNCLHGKAPSYLIDCCTPIYSDVASLTASSAFCQSSSTTRPSTQSLHMWSSGFFCRGSGCLELPERRTAWTVVNREQFQTVT